MITSSAALLLTFAHARNRSRSLCLLRTESFAIFTEPSIFAEDSNYIYPVWIVTELPVGLRGLILAGIFAAAISSLDSILAALSQTTLSLFKTRKTNPENEKAKLLTRGFSSFFGESPCPPLPLNLIRSGATSM